MKCPVCNAELPPTAKFCGGCGTTLTAPPQPPAFHSEASYEQARPMMNPPPNYGGNTPPAVQKKYKMLRFIAVIIKIFAFIVGAISIIGALVMLAAGVASSSQTSGFGNTGPTALFGGVVGGLLVLVYGVFAFVFLYAYAEWMYVFMDIEENTRLTNEMLSGRK